MTPGLVVGGLLFAGLALERVLLSWRWSPYYVVGFPIEPPLVPVRTPPRGAGRTATVRWEVDGPLVRFWADPSARAAPWGLHGGVHLRPSSRGIVLEVRWSPPWTPLIAVGLLPAIGAARGMPLLATTVAVVVGVSLLLVYRAAAIQAAAELRWAWTRDDDDPS